MAFDLPFLPAAKPCRSMVHSDKVSVGEVGRRAEEISVIGALL